MPVILPLKMTVSLRKVQVIQQLYSLLYDPGLIMGGCRLVEGYDRWLVDSFFKKLASGISILNNRRYRKKAQHKMAMVILFSVISEESSG